MANPISTPEEMKFQLPLRYDTWGQMIWTADDQRFCDMRGWGFLTGTGGLHLDDETAAGIQDARGQYLVEAVNNYEPLKQQVEELKGEVKRLTEWRLAYERLTPQGSEWVNDLPKCEAYVQQRIATGQKAEMRLMKAERTMQEDK